MVYGDRLILKLFRMLDPGVSPDLEIGRMLDAHAHFAHTPPLAGWLEYQAGREEPSTVGLLHGFIPNQGDAWTHAQGELSQYFERALTNKDRAVELPNKPLVNLVAEDQPGPMATEAIGAFLDHGRIAGAAHCRVARRAGRRYRRSGLCPGALLVALSTLGVPIDA